MNKKFELNEMELNQVAGGRPRVRPNPALSHAVHDGLYCHRQILQEGFYPSFQEI